VHYGVYLSPRPTGEHLLRDLSLGVNVACEACRCIFRAGSIEATETGGL